MRSSHVRPATGPTPPEPGHDKTTAEVYPRGDVLRLDELYDLYFGLVSRSLRRMGVRQCFVDDAVQDVYLVVHRRLPDFQARSQIKTWLLSIVLRVGQNYRRSARRRDARVQHTDPAEIEATADSDADGPLELAARREAAAVLQTLLAELGEEKRSIFVLVDMEGMTVAKAAEALRLNANTAYARLRAARAAFEAALARHGEP